MDDKGVNACKHKAMSYERMNAEPQAESKAAEAADAEEDTSRHLLAASFAPDGYFNSPRSS